jgi:hypothetical protein
MSKFVGGNEEAEAILRLLKNAPSVDKNPWLRLPANAPYVLPEDKAAVEEFNRTADPKYFLHVDKLLPEAFVGATDAPVVLLSNNPGFSADEEKTQARQSATFRELMWKNLRRESSDYPFVFLNPKLDSNDNGNGYWQGKLKHLIDRFGVETIARSVLNVVRFPYPSQRYGHQRLDLPSWAQEFSLGLVRDAVRRGAVVVLLRSGKANQKAWLEAVPELKGRLHLGKNPQAPFISRGNCPNCFNAIVDAVAAFKNSQSASA